ncbi:hypothetical protein K490DRAFT_54098 [Saccharata proteae CBS 121410]|uniref:Uncharacterized protein n=1 Tax=Saccharata proteae CBS 121410 TaxID=1314787 RepID=A0A9P4I2Y3_9PEZI|nr:hypothetical protein K490DRAFT_54098 [Saccharata proteae CBS 121410]
MALLASGFWLLASGFWLLASGCPSLRLRAACLHPDPSIIHHPSPVDLIAPAAKLLAAARSPPELATAGLPSDEQNLQQKQQQKQQQQQQHPPSASGSPPPHSPSLTHPRSSTYLPPPHLPIHTLSSRQPPVVVVVAAVAVAALHATYSGPPTKEPSVLPDGSTRRNSSSTTDLIPPRSRYEVQLGLDREEKSAARCVPAVAASSECAHATHARLLSSLPPLRQPLL